MNEWELREIAALIKLCRFLVTRADSKGMTHGEKHYLLQTVLQLLHSAQDKVQPDKASVVELHQVPDLNVSDIPF